MSSLDYYKAKIFHYRASPIDRFEGYISIHDLKRYLIDVFKKQPMQIHGIIRLLDQANMLIKRYHEEFSLQGYEFRDCDIYYDVIEEKFFENQEKYVSHIHLLLKEDNNGTMHLFTYHSLPYETDLSGNRLYKARHEYDEDWEALNAN